MEQNPKQNTLCSHQRIFLRGGPTAGSSCSYQHSSKAEGGRWGGRGDGQLVACPILGDKIPSWLSALPEGFVALMVSLERGQEQTGRHMALVIKKITEVESIGGCPRRHMGVWYQA